MSFAVDTAVQAIGNAYSAEVVDGWDVGGTAIGAQRAP